MFKFLNDCREIEELASKTYLHLSKNKSYPSELINLFAELSKDESSHARNIDVVIPADEKDLDAHLTVSWEKINDAKKTAKKFCAIAESGILDEEKALRMSVEMEQKFLKVHLQNVLDFQNPKLSAMFEGLGHEDKEHINKLKDCIVWWKSERKSSLA